MSHRTSLLHLLAALLVVAALQSWADRSTSVTFDELVLTSVGARAVMAGDDRMIIDQPPLPPLLYGSVLRVAGVELPDESAADWDFDARWAWGRALYFASGNDPRAVATITRRVGMAATALLLLLVWWVGRTAISPVGGVVALWATALHPEVVAHGAVAYNDLAIALAFLLGVWRLEVAARRRTLLDGVWAGLALAIAFGTKFSAIALIPVGGLLLGIEVARDASGRREARRGVGGAPSSETGRSDSGVGPLLRVVGTTVVAFWAGSMLLWGFDPTLSGLQLGVTITIERALQGHPAPAWLFGRTSPDGFLAFFPVAWFVKTPVVGIAVVLGGLSAGIVRLARQGRWARLAHHPMRGPLIGLLVFGAFVLRSSQNVGFRYALPALPLLALLAAWGWVEAFGDRTSSEPSGSAAGIVDDGPARGPRRPASVIGGLALVAGLASLLVTGPFWISYTSEWVPEDGPPALLDSSVDWGQGLLALRDWMEEEGVDRVELSYFGSGLPAGYGIDVRPLRSFLALPPPRSAAEGAPAEWVAISRTNLHGLYFEGVDPFESFRRREPEAVVGGSILLFRSTDTDP